LKQLNEGGEEEGTSIINMGGREVHFRRDKEKLFYNAKGGGGPARNGGKGGLSTKGHLTEGG